MLTAYTYLKIRIGGLTLLYGDLNELTYSLNINSLKGIGRQDILIKVMRQELGLSVVSGETEGRLSQVVCAE